MGWTGQSLHDLGVQLGFEHLAGERRSRLGAGPARGVEPPEFGNDTQVAEVEILQCPPERRHGLRPRPILVPKGGAIATTPFPWPSPCAIAACPLCRS